MRNKQAKKALHEMRHIMRTMNKQIENDPLWKGRFYIRQSRILRTTYFEDHSGVIVQVEYEMHDRRTGAMQYFYVDNYEGWWHYWEPVNHFIVDTVKVWDETPRPHPDTSPDYRGLPYA